jgi:hypothetical protein
LRWQTKVFIATVQLSRSVSILSRLRRVLMTRTVHYVGFRGDEYARAYRLFGGPVYIHKVYDDRVFTEVGDEDVVVFGPKYRYCPYVWDASGDC